MKRKYIRTKPLIPVKQRFFKFFKKGKINSCWNWMGNSIGRRRISGKGHGAFWVSTGRVYAHRYSYEINKGSIPKGLNVLHYCDNSLCVNPKHLYLGTQKQNVRDMIQRGRANFYFVKNAKFNWEIIKEIRHRRSLGESPVKLAKEFGTNYKHIWQICTNKRWKE